MKKLLLLTILFLAAACASSRRAEDFRCPNVKIPGDKSYLTQIVNYVDNFRIELTGYEGYCYVEDGLSRRYAVITPRFKVTRLRDNDETALDFRYFTEIVQGPPAFVGKKTYFASGRIDAGEKEAFFSGRPVKVKIPLDDDEIEVVLGLDVSAAEHMYNQRTFDTRSASRGRRGIIQTPCGFVETDEADFDDLPPAPTPLNASSASSVPPAGENSSLAVPGELPARSSGCGSCTVRR